MANTGYSELPQVENNGNEKRAHSRPSIRPLLPQNGFSMSFMLGMLLTVSMTANILLISRRFDPPGDVAQEAFSKYANLRRNVPTEIVAHNDFDSTNRTIQDAAWNAPELEPWRNFVALDEDYTIAVGLPHAQRWPWDKSKGTYILTGAHELHCVRALRVSINQNQDRVPLAEQVWQYGHLMHCLNLLRESVMCNADDTPLYTGHLHANANSSSEKAGIGSIKMCRDWNQLLEWSSARSACYRPVHWQDAGFPDIERYKFCPHGERPWEQVESG